MTDPLCICGHGESWHIEASWCDKGSCDCGGYARPGSLEDILGVWDAQGPFPLRNTADVALLVNEIKRLRADNASVRDYAERMDALAEHRRAHAVSWRGSCCPCDEEDCPL